MSGTLQAYLLDTIQEVLKRYTGAWLVWCDPAGDWLSLLQRVNQAAGKRHFTLHTIDEQTAGAFGSPQARTQLQAWIEEGTSFVLHVKTSCEQLGWLYAQALLAEEIHKRSVSKELRAWGWRPQNINTSEAEVARLARKNLPLALSEWGGGQIMPEPQTLLKVLAGGLLPWQEQRVQADEVPDPEGAQDERVVLELTVDEAGLPHMDEQNLERWRLEALAHLLVTQAHDASPQYFAHHDYLIAAEKRPFALRQLLERWLDSVSLRKGLPERIIDADRILGLGSYFSEAEVGPAVYLSQALERALFANVCARLGELRGRDLLDALVALYPQFERHAKASFWGDANGHEQHPSNLPWSELARLSRAVQCLLAAEPVGQWAHPDEAVAWYSQRGWQVEQAGEEIMRQLSKPTPELLHFITPLRTAYAYHWESYLLQWSDLWLRAGCPVPPYSSQGAWLKEQLKEARPTAVLMLDALRYDIGMALSQQINAREGELERAQVFPARTALPSITALGMGMALPIDEQELIAEIVNGKWQLSQQGQSLNLSLAENRRAWLRTHLKVSPTALLSMDKTGTANIPKATSKNARLFIFDDALDKLGHDEELEPLGTREVQERYLQTIEQLRNNGWKRVLIVTDHGFIHWPDINEQRTPLPLYDPAYTSRRALAYPSTAPLKGPQALAPGGAWRIAVPNGAECFRSYGGLGYFHGGASLQEWIVPCLKITWPDNAKPVEVRLQLLAQILSQRPKITIEVQHASLFGEDDALPRDIEIIVRDQQQRPILQSGRKTATPNQDQFSVILDPAENAEAARNTPMTIELRDANTKEILDMQTTILMVEIENW